MRLKYVAVFLLAALTAWIIPPAKTVASQKQTASLPEAIQINQPSSDLPSGHTNNPSETSQPQGVSTSPRVRASSGRHSTRAETQIPADILSDYLAKKGSPLAPYAPQILESPYWSTIIGICTIEQYGCTKAPGNNYWGIMSHGKLRRFESLTEGISVVSELLARYDDKGKDTIEELNGYYVVPASANWFHTVLTTKLKLESLTSP